MIRRRIPHRALATSLQRVNKSRKSKQSPKNANAAVQVQVIHAGNLKRRNTRKKNRKNRMTKILIRNRNGMTSMRKTNRNLERGTIITISISLLGVGITKSRIRINIGMNQRMIVRGSVRNDHGRSATSRGRGDVGLRGRRSARGGGRSDLTTGRARSGTGPTRDPDGSMKSTIGMSGLGTTTGGAHAAVAAPDTVGEHQVTNSAGCISLFI